MRYIHLVDNSDPSTPTDAYGRRVHKIAPLIAWFNETMPKFWEAGPKVAVDEMMCLFKGRLSFKQYNKDKPTKWGCKLFACACSESRFCLAIDLYAGANSDPPSSLGVSGDAVLRTKSMAGVLGSHRTIFADNWFSSPSLAGTLLMHKSYFVGTVSTKRKHYPAGSRTGLNVKLDKGDPRGTFKSATANVTKDNMVIGNVTVHSWVDSRPVNFVTTRHAPGDLAPNREAQQGRYPGQLQLASMRSRVQPYHERG